MADTIKLSESKLREMVGQIMCEEIENGEILEGWLSNAAKSIGGTVADKMKSGYHDMAKRFNNAQADDFQQKAQQLEQQVKQAPVQIRQQLKAYRSQLMKDLNAKVNQYEQELMAELEKQQAQYADYQDKAAVYRNQAQVHQQKYNGIDAQKHGANGDGQQAMAAESPKLDKVIREAIKKVIG